MQELEKTEFTNRADYDKMFFYGVQLEREET